MQNIAFFRHDTGASKFAAYNIKLTTYCVCADVLPLRCTICKRKSANAFHGTIDTSTKNTFHKLHFLEKQLAKKDYLNVHFHELPLAEITYSEVNSPKTTFSLKLIRQK